MREFTKSLMSYSWATSLFGLQQMMNVFRVQGRDQQGSPATGAFNNVTEATEEEFDDILKATFRAGDNLQRGMVDLVFSVFTLGGLNRDGGSRRMGSNLGQESAEAFRQGMRAVGQTVDVVGRTMQGAASATARAAQASTGRRQNYTRRGAGDAPDSSRSDSQQSSGWGPMPSQRPSS